MSRGAHWSRGYTRRSYIACQSCWGFVRLVVMGELRIALPEVAVGSEQVQAPAIRAAALGGGWRRATFPVREFDILMMRDLENRRHVGIAARPQHQMGLLHCTEDQGSHWVELGLLSALGYRDIEIWRNAA